MGWGDRLINNESFQQIIGWLLLPFLTLGGFNFFDSSLVEADKFKSEDDADDVMDEFDGSAVVGDAVVTGIFSFWPGQTLSFCHREL